MIVKNTLDIMLVVPKKSLIIITDNAMQLPISIRILKMIIELIQQL